MKSKRHEWLWMSIVLAMLATFLFSANRISAAPEGILKEAIHWNLSSEWLDPSTGPPGTLAYLPIQFFHDALVKSMPEGIYTPCLAESYDISQDARVFEFKLRRGTKFHNGDTLTAEDVVFSFWRYKGREAKRIHERTEKVEAVNPYLVRIHFKTPFPDFLEYLLPGQPQSVLFCPRSIWKRWGRPALNSIRSEQVHTSLLNLWLA